MSTFPLTPSLNITLFYLLLPLPQVSAPATSFRKPSLEAVFLLFPAQHLNYNAPNGGLFMWSVLVLFTFLSDHELHEG